ncbi:MBL fold metallo-hydrolase [Paenibacillus ihumii]|uniref:MBL fold metallo-hydrolase n=1 Tax=Paenibacillus ihumii TaxID=687436 RepID=UPI0006D78D28|nr:MBL fold metallo-hydrolase [Paenibacillus ihumii]
MKIRKDIYLAASGRLGFDWTHPADCNVYAVDTGEGVVLIDSGTGLNTAGLLHHLAEHGIGTDCISHVLLTHLHADHSGGACEIRRITGAKIAVLQEAAPILEAGDEEAISLPQAREAGLYAQDYTWNACKADILLNDGDRFDIGNYAFKVLHTPGHSGFDTCFYIRTSTGDSLLFSGDTVMYGGKISMLNTYDFSMLALSESMKRLAGLTLDVLLPGHGQPALSRASEHIETAHSIFSKLGIPANFSG